MDDNQRTFEDEGGGGLANLLFQPAYGQDGYGPFRPGQHAPAGGFNPFPRPAGGSPLPSTPVNPVGSLVNAPAGGVGSLAASGFDIQELLKYVLGGGLVARGLFDGGQGDIPPELNDMLGLQKRRLEASNPLYESVLRLAFSRLPTNATQGLSIPSVR